MTFPDGVPWDECIRALRRAGFVATAESPLAVVLVNARRSVLVDRTAVLDDQTLQDIFRAAALSREQFVALLSADASA